MENYQPQHPGILQQEEENPLAKLEWRRFILALVRGWRKILLVSLLFTAIGISLAMYLRGRAYTAYAVILRTDPPKSLVVGEGNHFDLPRLSIDTLIDSVKIPSNIQKVVSRLDLGTDVYGLIDRIKLQRGINSNLIRVSAVGSSAQEAVDIANTTCEVFVDYLRQLRRSQAEKALEEINTLVAEAKSKFNAASEEFAAFKNQHGIVLLDVETQASLEKIDELKAEIEETRIALQEVNRQIASGASVGPQAAALANLETEYEDAKMRYTAENPKLAKLKERIKAARQAMATSSKEALQIKRSTLITQINSLQSQQNELEQKLSTLTSNEKGFAAVKQKYDFNRELLESLVARREEASAMARGTQDEFRIIERAILPKYPEASKAKLVAAAFPVVGFIFIVFLVLLIEFINGTIRSAKEVFVRSGYPVLGQHLHNPNAPKNKPYLETPVFKPIAATITVENRLKEAKVFAFFSTVTGDGVTTISQNLANAFAERGKKVLFMDLSIHTNPINNFDMEEDDLPKNKKRARLSDWYSKQVELDALIELGGKQRPDSFLAQIDHIEQMEILGTPEFLAILEVLKERYDLIFIDSPPLFEVVQAIELVPIIDGVMLVVRSGYTRKDHFERIAHLLGPLKTPVLGVFIADAEPFFARNHEIVTTSAYRPVRIDEGFIENLVLRKLMS